MPENRVAVVVLNWNAFAFTNDCIQSLGHVTYPDFDVIVVDNGSSDHSGRRLKIQHPHIILLESPVNAGFSGGNNIGMTYAMERGYTYVLLLNNDTLVTPGFLQPLVAYLNEHPDVGIVQPKIFYQHDRSLIWNAGSFYNRMLGFPYTRGLGKKSQAVYDQIAQVDWVTGCAFLTRTEVLKKSGLFADNMFLYCEDVDLSFRIKALGYKLFYQPGAVIYHIAGGSGKTKKKTRQGKILPEIHYFNQRNRIWLLKRYTPWYFWPGVFVANAIYLLAVLSYFLLRARMQKFTAVLRAIKDGITQSISYADQGTVPLNGMEQQLSKA